MNALQDIGITEERDWTCLLHLLEIKRKVQAQEHQSAMEIFYELLAATGCITRFEMGGNPTAISQSGHSQPIDRSMGRARLRPQLLSFPGIVTRFIVNYDTGPDRAD